MRFLFVHQNFPGQFRHLARSLADSTQHQVVALGEAARLKQRPPIHPRIRTIGYSPHEGSKPETHHYIRDFEGHVRRGQSVARALLALRGQGFVPDVVVAHPGWGEALFLKDVFPTARLIVLCEYYYHASGGDIGFDPEFPTDLDIQLKARTRNATQLLSLVAADDGVSPTAWQHGRYPAEFHDKIRVMHEGIDTAFVRPEPDASLEISGRRFTRSDEIITYVARNLEPYRGFHVFMRALPELLKKRPVAQVLVLGGDEVSYGRRLPKGETYRKRYSDELGDRVDWSRVHFLGSLPYQDYLRVLQISSCHVYLTYPFVLSWSMLEAMSAGCALVASSTAPVTEVIRDGHNGHLVDFFDAESLISRIAETLEDPVGTRRLRGQARLDVVARFDLQTVCLPQWLQFVRANSAS